jgi:hypothetical protein
VARRRTDCPGTRWADAITRGISTSDALLQVVSRNSIKSPWIEREVAFFRAKTPDVVDELARGARNLIPILVGEIRDEEVPSELREIQWIDFRDDYDSALVELVTFLRPFAVSTGPIAPKSAQTKGYVFISYSEEDSEFFNSLRAFLKQYRYSYWDFAESDRNYQTQISRELEGIISDAAATLSVLSDHWRDSEWTEREFIFSEEIGVPVFLLKAKPIRPTLSIAGRPLIHPLIF